MFTSEYFNIGTVVATNGINKAMTENKLFAFEVGVALRKYCNKDFGDISDDDKQTNEEALQYPDDLYLLGAYQTCKGKIWIITNAAETVGENITTVLFTDER